jgi:hypothetical protein
VIKLTDYNSTFSENVEYFNFIFTEGIHDTINTLSLLTSRKTMLNKLRTELNLLEIHWTVKIHRTLDIGLIAMMTNLAVFFTRLWAHF